MGVGDRALGAARVRSGARLGLGGPREAGGGALGHVGGAGEKAWFSLSPYFFISRK